MTVKVSTEDDRQTVRGVYFRNKKTTGKKQSTEPAGTTRKFGIVPNPGKKKSSKKGGIGEGDCIYDYTTMILYCP